MAVKLEQPTPFVGVVATNRQKKKAEQGTQVEVRALKVGEYGPYALSFVNGNDKPIYLSLNNVDYVSPISDERQAELNAEREAWKARGSKPVVVGTDPDWQSERSVAFDWELHSGEHDVRRVRLFFPKATRNGVAIYDPDAGTVPQWIWDAKQKEFQWGEKLAQRWGS